MRLDLAYDGSGFAGWARQPGQLTVQGTLEDALATVLRRPVSLTVAGRTDAGVHATGQVCHADLAAGSDVAGLPRRANALLDPSVRVLAASPAPPGFDARFAALARVYRYRVSDAEHGAGPLRRHDTAAHPRPLSLRALRAAARPLVGEHDFASFCRRRQGATTIRALRRLTWVRRPDGVLVATVEADAFCHQMVRALVGALLLAGDGRRPVGWPGELLSRRARDAGAPVAPACGLTLVEVRYPAPSRLAARAAATRRKRS